MPMTEHVWFIYKPGSDRKYATPTMPSPEWAAAFKEQGYMILRIAFNVYDDATDLVVSGTPS